MVLYAPYSMDRPEINPSFSRYDGVFPVENSTGCKVSLKNKELWKKFHHLETEMIITKSGRRMFPSLQVQLSEMDPQASYCVLIEMVPAARCRYKYSKTGGWTPAGSEEVQSPNRIYLHPDSPAKGEYWMSQPISFGRLKLTNMPAPPSGQIVLSSMHKYQPRIIIAQTSDPRTFAWAPSTYFAFPETQFIAVTAYQNQDITQLKIDNNPFAKGFRQNGQAKCKRKRICMEGNQQEEDDELICVTDEDHSDLEHSNSFLTSASDESRLEDTSEARLSPRKKACSESGKESSDCSSPLPAIKCARIEDLTDVHSSRRSSSKNEASSPTRLSIEPAPRNVYPFSTVLPSACPPSTYFYPYYAMQHSTAPYGTPYFYQYGGYFDRPYTVFPKEGGRFEELKEPKKLTDFSIHAILGYSR